jgi:hypothetical protein
VCWYIYLCEEKSLTKSVKYDLLNTKTPDAVVVLKLLPSRLFNWSASTSFDAADPNNNSVVLQVIIQDEDDREKYEGLTHWLKLHQNLGCAIASADGEGKEILQRLDL